MDLAGKLLIAPPNVRGSFWSKTVVFVSEDHARGSMGLVLNKKSKITIADFALQCGIETDLPGHIYIGGPVNAKALTLLHSSEWTCGNTMMITSQFSISSSHDIMHRLAMGDCPKHWRLMLGLCAWAPDQLDSEMKGLPPYNHDFSWLTASSDYNLVFGSDGSDQWTQSIEHSGSEFVQSLLD
jgi:putative transcriptional regulator